MLNRMIQMLQLLIPYPPQGQDELRQLLPDLIALGLPLRDHLKQRADLRVVVPANLRLHGLGAGHGGLAAQDGRRPAEPRGEGGPHGVEGRGANAVSVEEAVEGLEVLGFLVIHVRHERPEVRVAADKGRRLGCVDEGGGELAGLVDAELVGGIRVSEVCLRGRVRGLDLQLKRETRVVPL